MPKIDQIPLGKTFGLITLVREVARLNGARAVECTCQCGNIAVVMWQNVKKGRTSSCGCSQGSGNKTHGESRTILHNRWKDMRYRCSSEHHIAYSYYGGRGIRVCVEWEESYESFRDWATANGFSPELTIERRDVDEGYSPNNCYWAPRIVQSANRRKTTGTKHRYIGVSQMRNGNWKAAICLSGEQRHLGVFSTEEEAVAVRDAYITENKLPHKVNMN